VNGVGRYDITPLWKRRRFARRPIAVFVRRWYWPAYCSLVSS